MKRRRRKRYRKIIGLFTILLLTLFLVICTIKLYAGIADKNENMIQSTYDSPLPVRTDDTATSCPSPTAALTYEGLVSENAILICLDDHQILLDKNSEELIYPASLTKIMTAIVAIESLSDLDQPITLPEDIFPKLYKEDASLAGFLPGETVSATDLLYGVLLPSGAECCIGLADYIAGSEEAFVKLMNEKAESLNMKNTNFTNSTGLHDPDHYTCVADLAVLLEYSLKNDTFREIFTSKKHSTQASSFQPDGITFYSTMFKNMDCPEFSGGSVLGGKTGYTSEAGLCLASLAVKDKKEYILITANAKGSHDTEQYNITDALYAYNNLKER